MKGQNARRVKEALRKLSGLTDRAEICPGLYPHGPAAVAAFDGHCSSPSSSLASFSATVEMEARASYIRAK